VHQKKTAIEKDGLTEEEKMKKISLIAIAPVILLSILAGCGRNTLYTETKLMTDEKWGMYDPATFHCTVNDTISSYDVSFSVRTSSAYPYRNLYLFVVTSFPSGTSLTDTIQYAIANEKGEWLGRGAGNIRELTLHYKTNVFFPEKGKYDFRVIHGMREPVLNGVYDFGMTIRKRKK
jgi:gliding motility-associated lipoprotein GldH